MLGRHKNMSHMSYRSEIEMISMDVERLGSSLKKMVLCLVVLCQAMVIMLEESVGHYMPFCFNFEAGFFFYRSYMLWV